MYYLPSTVGPATELEITLLIVKRKPCNVYLARALKDAWRDVKGAAVVGHDHVGLESPVELLVGAGDEQDEVEVEEEGEREREKEELKQRSRCFARQSGSGEKCECVYDKPINKPSIKSRRRR